MEKYNIVSFIFFFNTNINVFVLFFETHFEEAFIFLLQDEPLPDFNAYSAWDVIRNFWILGVIILVCIPYQLAMVIWAFSRHGRGDVDLWFTPECIFGHVVTL